MMEAASIPANGQSSVKKRDLTQRILIYSILFVVCYIVFFIVTFPYDLLLRGVIDNYQKQLPPSLKPLTYETLSIKLPLGVGFKGLSMGRGQSGAPTLEADSLTIKTGLISAIRGKVDATVNSALYGGKLSGTFVGSDVRGKVKMKLAGLKLDAYPDLKKLIKIDVSGKLFGSVDMDWNKQWLENQGTITFNIQDAAAKNVNIKVKTADFTFTKVEGEINMQNGTVTVKRLSLEGTPMGFELDGTITLNPVDMASSMLNLNVIFIPTPEFEKEAPFSMLQKAGEGKYKGHLGGTFRATTFP